MEKKISVTIILAIIFLIIACNPVNTISDLIDQNQEFTLEEEHTQNTQTVIQPYTPTILETFVVNPNGKIIKDKSIGGEEWTFGDEAPSNLEPGVYQVVANVQKVEYHMDALNHPQQFILYDGANADTLWPGSIVQGKYLLEGTLNPIPIQGENRKPINITIDVVTGNDGATYHQTVINPAKSTVTTAMNSIVSTHYNEEIGALPGTAYVEVIKVHSLEEVQFHLGGSYEGWGVSAEVNLETQWSQEKERVMVKFLQKYYTITVDPFQNANAVYADTVTIDDLAPFTAPDNPVCYVSSVTYGRMFVLLYEADNEYFDLYADLNFAYNNFWTGDIQADASIAYNTARNRSTVRGFAYGGDIAQALAATQDLNQLKDYIVDGAELSQTSQGAPISYSVRYLKNSNIAALNSTLNYTVVRNELQDDPLYLPMNAGDFRIEIEDVQVIDEQNNHLEPGQLPIAATSKLEMNLHLDKQESGATINMGDMGQTILTSDGGQSYDFLGPIIWNISYPPIDYAGSLDFSLQAIEDNKVILTFSGNEKSSHTSPPWGIINTFTLTKEFTIKWSPSKQTWVWYVGDLPIYAWGTSYFDTWHNMYFLIKTSGNISRQLVKINYKFFVNNVEQGVQ